MTLVDMIQVVLVTLILSVSAIALITAVISMIIAPFFMNRKDDNGEYLTKR